MKPDEHDIRMIPVTAIRIANPRVRERRKFDQIVRSISEQGLKRPITVTETAPAPDGKPAFDLVCGQGRLEAFIALGQTEIPAFVRQMSKADGSLAERNKIAALSDPKVERRNESRRLFGTANEVATIVWEKGKKGDSKLLCWIKRLTR